MWEGRPTGFGPNLRQAELKATLGDIGQIVPRRTIAQDALLQSMTPISRYYAFAAVHASLLHRGLDSAESTIGGPIRNQVEEPSASSGSETSLWAARKGL